MRKDKTIVRTCRGCGCTEEDYSQCIETTGKQEFIRLMFDSKLYYQGNTYRTPYIVPAFSHNALILKQKELLVIEEKKGLSEKVPGSGAMEFTVEPLINLLSFLRSTRVA